MCFKSDSVVSYSLWDPRVPRKETEMTSYIDSAVDADQEYITLWGRRSLFLVYQA